MKKSIGLLFVAVALCVPTVSFGSTIPNDDKNEMTFDCADYLVETLAVAINANPSFDEIYTIESVKVGGVDLFAASNPLILSFGSFYHVTRYGGGGVWDLKEVDYKSNSPPSN